MNINNITFIKNDLFKLKIKGSGYNVETSSGKIIITFEPGLEVDDTFETPENENIRKEGASLFVAEMMLKRFIEWPTTRIENYVLVRVSCFGSAEEDVGTLFREIGDVVNMIGPTKESHGNNNFLIEYRNYENVEKALSLHGRKIREGNPDIGEILCRRIS